MQTISESSLIAASPDVVWDVLTEFERYDDWNPFMSVVGRPNENARLVVELRPPGRRTVRFRPRVTAVVPNRELRWFGRFSVGGLYDGEHRFSLVPEGEGTRFVQEMTSSGALVGPINRWMHRAIERGFQAMNVALKARAEATAAGDGSVFTVPPAGDSGAEPVGRESAQ